MSENSTPEQRTELPTSRRMDKLRSEGTIFHSQDVSHAVSLCAGFLMLGVLAPQMYSNLKLVFIACFKRIANPGMLSYGDIERGVLGIAVTVGPDIFIFASVIAVAASLSVLIQTNFNVKKKKINFRFNLMNPLTGLTRIFSPNNFLMTLKAMLKLAVILPIAYIIMKGAAPEMISLTRLNIDQLLTYSGLLVDRLFWKIFGILLLFAVFDWCYGKWNWLKTNKMTKEEVKDEQKSIEGDEATKRKMIAKGMQRIMQRLKQTVPKADVIVTNPTHYAIALKYDKGSMEAPTVVAKGRDYMAARIKEIARESGIPVLERKALARALYKSTEVGSSIPRELFRAVAEVLAYVYKIRRKTIGTDHVR